MTSIRSLIKTPARCHATFLLLLAAVVTSSGCGLKVAGVKVRGFVTPVYRFPTGYSETYLEHLEEHEKQARQSASSGLYVPDQPPASQVVPGGDDPAASAAAPRPHNPPPPASGHRDGSTSR